MDRGQLLGVMRAEEELHGSPAVLAFVRRPCVRVSSLSTCVLFMDRGQLLGVMRAEEELHSKLTEVEQLSTSERVIGALERNKEVR